MAADRDNDDIAAALHGLHAGDHADTHHGDAAADHAPLESPAPPTAPKSIPKPATSRPQTSAKPPSAAKRPAAPVARPAMPPVPPPAPAPKIPPPARPVSAPASGSSSSRARPAAPGMPGESYDENISIEDDSDSDATTAPALDYRGPAVRTPRPRKPSFFKSSGFRQTLIPILLTTGLMMIVLGVAHWLVDEEAALALVPAGVSAMLIAVGGLLILLGVANMLLVRNDLARRRPPATT